MKLAVTKVSSDDYMIQDFPTIESLIAFMKKAQHALIIEENMWYKKNPKHLPPFPGINVDELVSIPYEIEIYDDYRE